MLFLTEHVLDLINRQLGIESSKPGSTQQLSLWPEHPVQQMFKQLEQFWDLRLTPFIDERKNVLYKHNFCVPTPPSTLEKKHSWFLDNKKRFINLQIDQIPFVVLFQIPSSCKVSYFTFRITRNNVSLRGSSIPTLKAQALNKNAFYVAKMFPTSWKPDCDKSHISIKKTQQPRSVQVLRKVTTKVS